MSAEKPTEPGVEIITALCETYRLENERLHLEMQGYRMREQVAKAAHDAAVARAESAEKRAAKAEEDMRRDRETNEAEAAMDAEEKQALREKIQATEALCAELRTGIAKYVDSELSEADVHPCDRNDRTARLRECRHVHELDALLTRTPADMGAEIKRLRGQVSDLGELIRIARGTLEIAAQDRDALRQQLAERDAEVARLKGLRTKAESIMTDVAEREADALRARVSELETALRNADNVRALYEDAEARNARLVAELEQQVQLDDKAKRVMVQWHGTEKKHLKARNARLVAAGNALRDTLSTVERAFHVGEVSAWDAAVADNGGTKRDDFTTRYGLPGEQADTSGTVSAESARGEDDSDEQVIRERDEAEARLDEMASLVLGEPIDWTFHDAKWDEALQVLRENNGAPQTNTANTEAPLQWHEGEPPHPFKNEWFIAKLTGGERAVLRALPKEYSYDYTTADETYYSAARVAGWMQFPDSEFVYFSKSKHPDSAPIWPRGWPVVAAMQSAKEGSQE